MGDQYSYIFPGGLSIEYNHRKLLRIGNALGALYTKLEMPLNDNDTPFMFEENNETNHYTFTSIVSDNSEFKLHVLVGPWSGQEIYIHLDFHIDDNVFEVSEITRDVTSIDDRNNITKFISRLIEIGRAVRDGTPLPVSHNLDGPAPAPAQASELRNLPADATNAITYDPIANGTNMVNFHGEFDHGRYYKRNTFAQLPAGPNGRKRNPYTQQNIMNTRSYRARIPPQPAEGGRRRKTRCRRHSSKKN